MVAEMAPIRRTGNAEAQTSRIALGQFLPPTKTPPVEGRTPNCIDCGIELAGRVGFCKRCGKAQ